MTEYKLYKTTTKEHWSSIAYKLLGNCFDYKKIIEANPHVSITAFVKAGETLRIPMVEENEITTNTGLPIWKQ